MKDILVSLFVLILIIQGGLGLYGHLYHPQNFLRLQSLQVRYGKVFGRILHITSHVVMPWFLALLVAKKIWLN
jgi:Ni,Fe-hydrogenase I cytochrome b subunit